MPHMYGGNILLINLSDGKITREPTESYAKAFIGGHGVNTKLLYDHVTPETDPLAADNMLIFGTGPLCGTPVPSSRTEVTAKSPETGLLGTSDFGGFFAPEFKFAGYDNIAITGKADKPVFIWINNDRVEIRDASHLWGKDTFQAQQILRSEVDPDAKIACIGQAGEHLVRFASVQHALGHGGGRTGMGAVMGSKNLKAIAVKGSKGLTLANPEKYLNVAMELQMTMRNDPRIQDRQQHGMAYEEDLLKIEANKGKATQPVYAHHIVNKHQPKRSGCMCCPVQCMDLYPVSAKGGGMLFCVYYFSTVDCVKNTDLELALECSLMTQRWGLDVISSLEIIGWLMDMYEAGFITPKDTDGITMTRSSRDAMLGMLKKMAFREGFGDVLADGMLAAAKKMGNVPLDRVPHMKGLPLFEGYPTEENLAPIKGMALGVAVGSRGDSMRGGRTGSLEEPWLKKNALLLDPETSARNVARVKGLVKELTGSEEGFKADTWAGKPEMVRYIENRATLAYTMPACRLMSGFNDFPYNEDFQARLFSAGTGIETSVEDLFKVATRIRHLERAFQAREGVTREQDSYPKGLIDKNINGSILETSKFEEAKSRYYALRGWDVATGVPTKKTLEEYGLGDIAQDLARRGKLPQPS